MWQRDSRISMGSRYVVFFLLYFVQGIPYGFQTRYLPILFRKHGMELAQVGLFKLLMVPWLFKPVWAGLVDNYFTRKFWLNVSIMVLSVLCMIAAFIPPSYLMQLAIIMFIFNIATSVQDIALDSIVIDTLTPLQLAKGNIAQVVGYKTGGLFSGGAFSLLSDMITWEYIFFTLAGTYILGLFISLSFLPEENSSRESADSTASESRDVGVQCYFSNLMKSEGTWWLVIFVLLHKIGEMGASNMFPMFMLDNGVSSHMVGFWTAFIGQGVSLGGSVLGGLIDPRHLHSNLKSQAFLRTLSIAVTFLGVVLWNGHDSLSYVLSIVAYQGVMLTGGATTTIIYTLVMTLSQKTPKRCRASHYTIVTSADVLGRLAFAPITAGATQWFGYPISFFMFTLASLFVVLQLAFAPTEITSR